MIQFDLRSDAFRTAVLKTERRSERQIYDDRLVKCFVPNRVLEELITMDYGTYASFRGTQREPEQQLFWPRGDPKTDKLDLVPFDDRRSIRRIVVEKAVLDDFWAKMADPNPLSQ